MIKIINYNWGLRPFYTILHEASGRVQAGALGLCRIYAVAALRRNWQKPKGYGGRSLCPQSCTCGAFLCESCDSRASPPITATRCQNLALTILARALPSTVEHHRRCGEVQSAMPKRIRPHNAGLSRSSSQTLFRVTPLSKVCIIYVWILPTIAFIYTCTRKVVYVSIDMKTNTYLCAKPVEIHVQFEVHTTLVLLNFVAAALQWHR